VNELLARSSGTYDLPAWRRGPQTDNKWPHQEKIVYESELTYNNRVADTDPQYVRMDQRFVNLMPGRSSKIEICDLLGPKDGLIHVKRADGSGVLSHLLTQARVSLQALERAEVRQQFADLVGRYGRGRTLTLDFVPRKVGLAILLKDGEELNADTLFPFSQVALVQAARELEKKVELEIIGIRAEARTLS
jgi:uncharacterized protein (TIGR04141 family)